jgi:hypothetical protein
LAVAQRLRAREAAQYEHAALSVRDEIEGFFYWS